jgi:hypothetical protein
MPCSLPRSTRCTLPLKRIYLSLLRDAAKRLIALIIDCNLLRAGRAHALARFAHELWLPSTMIHSTVVFKPVQSPHIPTWHLEPYAIQNLRITVTMTQIVEMNGASSDVMQGQDGVDLYTIAFDNCLSPVKARQNDPVDRVKCYLLTTIRTSRSLPSEVCLWASRAHS